MFGAPFLVGLKVYGYVMFACEVEATGAESEQFRVLGGIGGEDGGEAGLEFWVCGEWVGFYSLKD